ncbi:PilW family protein [Acinetobacter sp. YH16032]|uniref:PilW family protein n=1 Tax=Acinetobacter sp. YH16032 TaxID=2601181 RepID=UPI0015D12ADD|nr:prepilin-type N-terminal cleavage/methylation domain-containing protein [Acinetobacter sp. YH16032]
MSQKGFTLIELMVGLVIALLCMIMMLMLFKQTTQIGINSSQDSEYDAQIRTGLLVAQKLIQNAGYGTGNSNDIVSGTFYSNPAIFWRFIPNIGTTPTTYQCQGLAEKISDDGNSKLHRLVLLKRNCGSDTDLTDANWLEDQVIVAFRSSSSSPIFSYALNAGKCTPYGIDKNNSNGLKKLTITAQREHMTGTGGSIRNTVCLNNIIKS